MCVETCPIKCFFEAFTVSDIAAASEEDDEEEGKKGRGRKEKKEEEGWMEGGMHGKNKGKK